MLHVFLFLMYRIDFLLALQLLHHFGKINFIFLHFLSYANIFLSYTNILLFYCRSDGEYATDWSSTEDSDNASEDAELDSDVDGDTSESEDGRSEEDSFQLDHTQ